jgi:hypothetical protein
MSLFCNDPRLPEGQQQYVIPIHSDLNGLICKSDDGYLSDEAYIEELVRIIEDGENCRRD